MRVYLKQNVLEAALERIRRIFDGFPNVIVDFSGGKDSTTVLNLALRVAEEKGRLPVKVMFIDQEAEWRTVIDYIRSVMSDPRVEPVWFQGPFRLFNATTTGEDPWLHCWEPGRKWLREKEPCAIKENVVGTDRFKELFTNISLHYFGDVPTCHIAGVRCEESPGRMQGLTYRPVWQEMTFGHTVCKRRQHFVLYPLYDWYYSDIWKAIHDHRWPYCKLYDYLYQYGIQVRDMRVSNVHHETAIGNLKFLQEIEPDTWDAILDRLQGVNAVKTVREAYQLPKELPFMFRTWREYRDHLLENLIVVPEIRAKFREQFARHDKNFRIEDPEVEEALVKTEIAAILVNDYEGTKHGAFKAGNPHYARNRGKRRDEFSRKGSRVQ